MSLSSLALILEVSWRRMDLKMRLLFADKSPIGLAMIWWCIVWLVTVPSHKYGQNEVLLHILHHPALFLLLQLTG